MARVSGVIMPKAEVAALLRAIADEVERDGYTVKKVEVQDWPHEAWLNVQLVKEEPKP